MDEINEGLDVASADYVALTSEVVSAYVSNNSVRPADLPELLSSVHATLSALSQGDATDAVPVGKLTPAQIRKSITPDALISFEDGKASHPRINSSPFRLCQQDSSVQNGL
jgi:predicted transcriptional regulator